VAVIAGRQPSRLVGVRVKIAHDKRARVFIDPKLGSARFGDECEKWISRHAGTELTKEAYKGILRSHVGPVLGDRTLAAVAQFRDDVIDLLTIRLGEGSNSRRKIARALITGVLDEAVRAGKITMHRCGGITLPDNGGNGNHDDFVFPTHGTTVPVCYMRASFLPTGINLGDVGGGEPGVVVVPSCAGLVASPPS